MPDRCPRCNRKMDNIAMWWPVNTGNDDPIHVCGECAKEAEQIDKAYAEECTKAKRIWLGDVNIKTDVLPTDPCATVKEPTKL